MKNNGSKEIFRAIRQINNKQAKEIEPVFRSTKDPPQSVFDVSHHFYATLYEV